MAVKPCQAQTLTDSNASNTNNASTTPQPITSNPTGQSNLASDAVSQTSSANPVANTPNPRTPIPSRIFDVPTMQQ
ncbi:MAG: hypothetical protein IGS39_24345 [Calothrix sp. C42_A2020_038]|nr:hypothetical protein [Calothrix sp. C42_A2020_038]